MHGTSRKGTTATGGEAASVDSSKHGSVEAFEIGQVAGRPLYLVIGTGAEPRLSPGLPFTED